MDAYAIVLPSQTNPTKPTNPVDNKKPAVRKHVDVLSLEKINGLDYDGV